jgi:hypothetical protein
VPPNNEQQQEEEEKQDHMLSLETESENMAIVWEDDEDEVQITGQSRRQPPAPIPGSIGAPMAVPQQL